MAEITASMVKELREKTGAGMMECKKALQETGGDIEAAVDELRKRGQAIAQKKGGRATREGRIFAKVADQVGVLVEINCETDFVARNEQFVAFGDEVSGMALATASGRLEDLLATPMASRGKPLAEALTDVIAKIGENMAVSRMVRYDASAATPAGAIAAYIHPPGKLGVMLEIEADKVEALKAEQVVQLGRDLAMQVAAAAPVSVSRDEMPAATLERELAIYRDQAKMEGKPEAMWAKISEGKLNKFFKQSCLTEQEFVKDPDLTIAKLLEKVGKEVGAQLKVRRFERFEVGGAAEAAE